MKKLYSFKVGFLCRLLLGVGLVSGIGLSNVYSATNITLATNTTTASTWCAGTTKVPVQSFSISTPNSSATTLTMIKDIVALNPIPTMSGRDS